MKHRVVITAAALLWILTGSIPAHARTIKVQKGSKIQKAINSAAAGDTVLVEPGTYFENINFHGKAITVISAQGPKVTTIDGQSANSTVTFDSSETRASVLSGFTITHGAARGLPENSDGGGILVSNDVGPTITNNIITQNCASSGGGGIALISSQAIVKSNTITNNTQCAGTTGGCGGGIEVLQLSMPTIASNTISNNSWPSGDGGGICVFGSGFPIIMNNLISGNAAFGSSISVGGGIASFSSQPSIVQDVIVGNRADFGAGVSFDDSSLLVNNTIAANVADQNAGSALYVSGLGTAELFNNLLIGAPVEDVVYCDPILTIFSPVFENNDAFSAGGPPFIGTCESYEQTFGNISAEPEFENAASNDYQLTPASPAIDAGLNTAASLPATDFAGNPRVVAGTPGAAAVVDLGAYEYQPAGATGTPQPTPSATPTPIPPGTVLRVPQDFLTIQDAIDVASEGDVIEVSPGTYFENIDFGVHNLTVVSTGGPQVTTINPHGLGSVVSIEGGQTNASVLEGFTLTEGYTGVAGGGVSISRSSPVIRGNVITGNFACSGGGGIAVTSGSPIIEGNQITANAQLDCSGGGGGGIWLEGPGTAQIIGNTISNHFWINGSGIWMDDAGSPLLMNNFIVDNLVGGGVNITDNTTPTLIQNIIAGNTGGGIYFSAPLGPNGLNFINNTIAFNSTNTSYGPLASVEAAGTDDLVLFAGNLVITDGQVALKCDPFPGHMPPTFENNDVFAEGGTALQGACADIVGTSANISAEPLFADGPSLDFRLLPNSPAIDAGLNSAPGLPATDFYGGPRIVSGIMGDAPLVDIGAVEYAPGAATPTATTTAVPTPSPTPTIPPVLPTPTATRTPTATFSPTPVPERIKINPKSLDFGKIAVGATSQPKNITILNPFHNSGFAVSVQQPTVEGPFSASATCPAMLTLGDHCKITVTFQPTARKHYREDLLINDNVVGSPQHVHISGEGK